MGNVPGEDEVHVGIGRPRSCGTPFDGVDFLVVRLEIMDTGVLLHRPDLESHVIRARCQ